MWKIFKKVTDCQYPYHYYYYHHHHHQHHHHQHNHHHHCNEKLGYVICGPTDLCPIVMELKAQLFLVDMLEHRPLFTPGYDAMMHCHTVDIECSCSELISVTDKVVLIKHIFMVYSPIGTPEYKHK